MNHIAFALTAIIVTLMVHLKWNLYLWGKKIHPKHKLEWFFYAIGYGWASYQLSFYLHIGWFKYEWINTGIEMLIAGFMIASDVLFLFDGLYNIYRPLRPQLSWWFTGSEDGKNDASTDNFLQKLTLTQHKILKFGLMFISLALYLFVLYKSHH